MNTAGLPGHTVNEFGGGIYDRRKFNNENNAVFCIDFCIFDLRLLIVKIIGWIYLNCRSVCKQKS